MALSASVAVTIDRDDFARFVATDPVVDDSFRGFADRVAGEMRARAPVRSGRLAASITVERARDPSGRFAPGYTVGPTVDYAGYVVGGTAPHRIDGRPLLAFHWARIGEFVVLPHVQHPGTAPNRFMDDALAAVF